MNLKRQAFNDLWQHYKKVFALAWADRLAMEPVKRLPHEYEFLPATLALQETPIHPAPRYFMRAIVLFAVLCLLWSIFGKLDVVASAQGKIVPDSRSKIIQPLETASITAIHVKDGQQVKRGEVLVELDAAAAQADIDRLEHDQNTAQLDVATYQSLLQASEHVDDTVNGLNLNAKGFSPELLSHQNSFLIGQYKAFTSKYAQYSAAILKHDAEMRSVEAVLKKYEETLPILQQRESDLKNLLVKNYVSKHDYLTAKANLIEQQNDYLVQKERYGAERAARLEAERDRSQFTADSRRSWLDRLHESEQRLVVASQDLSKANTRGKYMTLHSPVDGVVQQLNVHTLGGVVTPAQPLMTIVPDNQTIEIEAYLSNQDIGFVHSGQPVEVKIETFSFTKYGTLPGEVISVSSDAIQDEKRGLIFAAHIFLKKDHINIDGTPIKLSSGMAVTAEIKIRQRRVIEYFLDPLIQRTSESLRER